MEIEIQNIDMCTSTNIVKLSVEFSFVFFYVEFFFKGERKEEFIQKKSSAVHTNTRE